DERPRLDGERPSRTGGLDVSIAPALRGARRVGAARAEAEGEPAERHHARVPEDERLPDEGARPRNFVELLHQLLEHDLQFHSPFEGTPFEELLQTVAPERAEEHDGWVVRPLLLLLPIALGLPLAPPVSLDTPPLRADAPIVPLPVAGFRDGVVALPLGATTP